jgi:SAM-dependent methyltransferase
VLPVLFGTTILVSSCLLFLVQPLSSKLILPWFGGSSAVWISCMLFFQVLLLVGYLYAHALNRLLQPPGQARLHIVLLLGSLAVLPILPNPRWQPKPGDDPTWFLLGSLAGSVGLPYLLLSSTSPLLQNWYGRTARGILPYRYFALSNLGSLAALLSYPVLIEPYLTGHQQAWLWSTSFALFAVLGIVTAVLVSQWDGSLGSIQEPGPKLAGISGRTVFLWTALPACASALLLSVTNLLTQNIAPMPLLWVLPLALYLLTFIFCFESDRWYRRAVFLALTLPALAGLGAVAALMDLTAARITIPLLTLALFICCMTCHGELARLKPEMERLTTFYLCLSAGGAMGGLFVGLIAPHVFRAMYENPSVLVACASLLLFLFWPERERFRPAGVGRHLWMSGLAGTVLLASYLGFDSWGKIRSAVLLERNFYGALRVEDSLNRHRVVRELSHGTIVHGLQFRDPILRHQLTTYYSRDSGIGLTWRTLESSGPLRMGVVGLGAGTLAGYGRAGDVIRFYEINPLVESIARTQFTYLADCPAHTDIVLGDARLSLAHEPGQGFDILVVDAFSGDAIPVHLLTREAFQIYRRHLKPDGVIAVHVSNRYLDLAPVVALAARENSKRAWQVDTEDNNYRDEYGSSYVLVSSRAHFFETVLFTKKLIGIDVPAHMRPWTDDYSNLWQLLSLGGER